MSAPALLTQMSTLLSSRHAASTRSRQPAAVPRSAITTAVARPRSRISRAVSSAPSREVRAETTTSAPPTASSRAMARPIPLEAPVTTAPFPRSSRPSSSRPPAAFRRTLELAPGRVRSERARGLVDGRLAERLLDIDPHALRRRKPGPLHLLIQAAGDPVREPLRRGVLDRKEDTVFPRKHPLLLAGNDPDARSAFLHLQVRARTGDQHVMVELIDQPAQDSLQGNEVVDQVTGPQRPPQLRGDAVVVAVKALAFVVVELDEMGGAENQVILGYPHPVLFHGWTLLMGRGIIPLRMARNKEAPARSALVPGLRRWPSARSQRSSWARARPARGLGQPSARTARARAAASRAAALPHLRAMRE